MGFVRAILSWMGKLALFLVVLGICITIVIFCIARLLGPQECKQYDAVQPLIATSSPAVALHQKDLSATADYSRTEASTFIQFPEWYIVYGAREYAGFLERGGLPSEFPYFRSIAQF